MKKRLLSLMIVMTIVLAALTGCATSDGDPGSTDGGSGTDNSGDETPSDSGGRAEPFTTVADMFSEFNRLSEMHMDAFEGHDLHSTLLMFPLAMSGMSLREAMELSLQDGKSGDPHEEAGFIEKRSHLITTGKEYTIQAGDDENGYSGWEIGDRKIESGRADLSAGTFSYDRADEHAGAVKKKERYDFWIKRGLGVLLFQTAQSEKTWDGNGIVHENEVIFVTIDENRYSYVMAKGETGVDFDFLSFESSLSINAARALFERAGFTVSGQGYAEGGMLVEP